MDWLPGATKSPMHETGFDWQVPCPAKIVLHTTEGSSWPAYPPQYEPHLTVKPLPGKGIEVRQHIAFNQAAYALKHPAGTPATNGAHAFQIEMIGTCDKGGPGLYWPEVDDVVLKALWDQVLKPLCDAFSVPLHALPFKAYNHGVPPTSSGLGNGVRLSDSQWLAFSGICGHQHVPGNDHGDPGAFPFARLVALANVTPPKPTVDPINGPLKYGSKGSDVSRVQHRLDQQLGVSLTVDGDFGRATQREVIAWQKKHSLTQDGVVGPNTAKSMGFTYSAA